jgi:hypothetical protein
LVSVGIDRDAREWSRAWVRLDDPREAAMAERPVHPMAAAMQWVARVFAAALMMVLPGLGGQWLDDRWRTHFLGLAGFAVGLIGGVGYLIAVTRQADAARRRGAPQATHERTPGGDERGAGGTDE